MSNIDIKLKSYDELVFEITTLNTNNYIKDLKIKELEKRLNKAIEYINEYSYNLKYELRIEELEVLYDILKGNYDKEQ